MSTPRPNRRTDALRLGRVSKPGARYFVTVCTAARTANLPLHVHALDSAQESLHASAHVTTLAFTCMPDHIHWLFVLTGDLTVSQVIGRWKTQARKSAGWATLHWQENFFEHRLRESESIEAFAYYIFMNPYRAHLVDADTLWPNWRCPNPGLFPFLSACRPGPLPSAAAVLECGNREKPWIRQT